MEDNKDIDEFDSFMDGEDSLSDLQKAVDLVIGKKELDALKGELSHDQTEVAYQDIKGMMKNLYIISVAVQIKKHHLELKDASLEKIIELINISVDPSHSNNTADYAELIRKATGANIDMALKEIECDIDIRRVITNKNESSGNDSRGLANMPISGNGDEDGDDKAPKPVDSDDLDDDPDYGEGAKPSETDI